MTSKMKSYKRNGFSVNIATAYNTAFTKLAKMNVVRTLRECPERYMKGNLGAVT
jgi:hypothetical protein